MAQLRLVLPFGALLVVLLALGLVLIPEAAQFPQERVRLTETQIRNVVAVEGGVRELLTCFVRHADCPWVHWHKRLDLLHEDRPGCDLWFQTAVDDINKALGTKLKVETKEALPDGDSCCLRRFWVED